MKPLLGIVVFAGALLLSSVPAIAHAVLETSAPAAGERVEQAPGDVTLTFDEPVETALGSLRVLDASGVLRSSGAVTHPGGNPARIAVRVGPLERGRYIVAWQVVSADSHIVDGAYAFGVGVAAGPAPVAPAGRGAVLLAVIHFGMLAGVLLGIGLPLGAVTVGRRTPRPPGMLEFGAWIALAFCAFADLVVRANLTGGALASALTTHVGVLRLITIAAALAAVAAVGRRRRWWGVLVPACAAAAVSLSLAGHAAGGGFPVVGVVADTAHLLAAATWIGVLATGLMLGPTEDLRGISPVAIAAVAMIVVSGIVQTLRDAGSVAALATTIYGREIDLKIVLMLAALGVALTARRALARSRFAIGRLLKLELCLLTAVIAVTAVLVESPLPREAAPAPITASFAVRDVTVHASASATGERSWEFHVGGTAGGAAHALDGVEVSVRESARNVGPLPVPMSRAPDGSFDGATTLPFAGTWSALIAARVGDFDENYRTIPLKENNP